MRAHSPGKWQEYTQLATSEEKAMAFLEPHFWKRGPDSAPHSDAASPRPARAGPAVASSGTGTAAAHDPAVPAHTLAGQTRLARMTRRRRTMAASAMAAAPTACWESPHPTPDLPSGMDLDLPSPAATQQTVDPAPPPTARGRAPTPRTMATRSTPITTATPEQLPTTRHGHLAANEPREGLALPPADRAGQIRLARAVSRRLARPADPSNHTTRQRQPPRMAPPPRTMATRSTPLAAAPAACVRTGLLPDHSRDSAGLRRQPTPRTMATRATPLPTAPLEHTPTPPHGQLPPHQPDAAPSPAQADGQATTCAQTHPGTTPTETLPGSAGGEEAALKCAAWFVLRVYRERGQVLERRTADKARDRRGKP